MTRPIALELPRGEQTARRLSNRAGERRSWYRITNEADTRSARVDIYDEIGFSFWGDGVTAAGMVAELAELDVDQIDLHINSPGGDVYEGIAILNALRQHPARVVTTVDGIAASAASYIAMAGDEIVMARNAEMMIHEARGICIGFAADMHDLGDRLDKISDNIASIYAAKAGGDVADWRAAMTAETWYSDEEAVDAGLADRVLDHRGTEDTDTANNMHDLSVFAHAGRRHAPAPPLAHTDTRRSRPMAFTDDQLTTMREKLGLAEDASDQDIVDALVEALDEQAADPAPANSLPAGVVAVDAEQLAALQAAARRGDEARAEQEVTARAALVDAAVNDGRIPPARREAWLNQLAADPGAAATLADLAPGLVPLEARGRDDAPEADNALYNKLFGKAS